VAGGGAPTREGYDFLGWATSQALASAGTADLTNGTVVDWTASTSKTAYAAWRAKAVEVRFYNNYTSADTSQYAPGNAANSARRFGDRLSPFTAPTRTGYTFTGWYDAPAGGGLWDFATRAIGVHPALGLYAHWTAQPLPPQVVVVTPPPTVVTVPQGTSEVEELRVVVHEPEPSADAVVPIPAPQVPTSALPPSPAYGHWSLLNLILAIAALFLLVLLMLGRREEDAALKVVAVTAAVAAIAVFLLTQELTQPMQVADLWTILHVVIVVVQAGVVALSRKNKKEEEDRRQVDAY
jgi:uncharacterized repeat protein (TIGR02543 family)